MKKRSKIAVDAMGGDQAPEAIVDGAVQACREFGVEITLVGRTDILKNHLRRLEATYLPISIKHASEIIRMDDNPLDVVRKKKDSSINVGLSLVAAGKADAFFSAGNSGAIVSAALFTLKRIKGIDRPAIATVMPSLRDRVLLADAGANTSCKPYQLAQFAIMCTVFSRYVFKRKKTRVALLSNGEEDTKGTEMLQAANALLKESNLNYVGFIEGGDVFSGKIDVVICDGFTGNILLKTAEGVAESFGMALRDELRRGIASRIGYLFTRSALMRLKKRFDYAEYGCAPLLGVNGPVLIGHGRSTARAVKNAIRAARDLADSKLIYHLQNDLDVNKDLESIARKPSLIERVFTRSGQ